MNILSFGGGVNSTSLLVLAIQGKLEVDAILFADTKCEMPETYEHLEKIIKPLCKENKIPFYEVTKGNLLHDYWEKNLIPFRAFRSCTDNYKIRPLKKFAKQFTDVTWIIGIDYGEKHRAERFNFFGSNHIFPLIDMEIDREGCKQIIKDFGMPIPVKSGCWFCPFTSKNGWISLYENHRDLFENAMTFEKNCKKYPEYTLIGTKTLEETEQLIKQFLKTKRDQKSLCGWIETKGEPCIFCHS